MIKNFLKIAWRNLKKNKVYSLINIVGLAIGLVCFLLIALYVVNELSYDRYNEKADRIYRIHSDIRFGGSDMRLAVTADPMGESLKKDYPQVEEYVRFYNSNGSKHLKKGTTYINETSVVHADSTLFNVFSLPSIAGDTKTALNEPNTVVITRTAAEKYFGSTDVIGKTIESDENGSTLYKVTAVIEDLPNTSHFQFDFFFSMDNVDYTFGNFLSHNFHTYLLLKPGVDPSTIEKKFPQYLEKYVLPQASAFMNLKSMKEFEQSGNKLNYSLMPLTRIHLYSDRHPELGINGNIQYVYIFGAVALFILIIACINFMNLTTARSANRAKEVGIRKVMGSEKKALIGQFLAESILTALLAFLLAILLTTLLLPAFNNLASKDIQINELLNWKWMAFLFSLPILVGIMAGSYPAFFLSSFKPIAVLKGRWSNSGSKSYLRSTLVVIQFATSIILMIGTVVVFQQLHYIRNKKLGFNKEQLLVINGTYALGEGLKGFKDELQAIPGVHKATISNYLPVGSTARNSNAFSTEAVMKQDNAFNMQSWLVDEDYIETMGMSMARGRNFSKQFGNDSLSIIINESTAKMLGYEDPIGKKIYASISNRDASVQGYTIIGIVKNFHFESLHQEIGPLALVIGKSDYSIVVRTDSKNIPQLLSTIESKWKTRVPSMPFEYQFMDESFDNMYRAEARVSKIALVFASLAIFIACMGLFGLATYMAEQRTKEIGVRKVLGASVQNIVGLLSRDFLKLVLVATVIAFPVGYLLMHRWLEDFAYRINIGWWIFLAVGILAVLIAIVTVSFQAIRAALLNPVKSLRTE
ncbi:ABC transporter permease [Flavihumibacter rivuli]|uniref:ABC transporter permease n=1 Tax=Flavihumibacter rivuli TaxID=2838156 RepID=UPI001BDE746B|nr:ABC transporter permease [Flavihumibacter rivuli]ULQ57885.1 ABC transporter permease [Flavihumibacter rivuli]